MSRLTPVYCACAASAAVLLLLPVPLVDGGQLSLWHRVQVSQAKVLSSNKLNTHTLSTGAKHNLKCANVCLGLKWCNLWCHDPFAMSCTFVNTIVMPTYVETVTADYIPCYTRRPKDYAATANITAAVHATPLRVKENLIDGFYGYTMDECYSSGTLANDKWLVMDIGKTVFIRHVVLIAQPNSYAKRYARDIEVRVGTSAVTPPEGLSTYDLFGRFKGPATSNQEIVFESPKRVPVRFVSVQRVTGSYAFQVAHMEIY